MDVASICDNPLKTTNATDTQMEKHGYLLCE